MGKKKNKSFYKKNIQSFLGDNKVLLAALGGVAAGISIASILGTEKAKQIVETLGETAKDYTEKLKQNFTSGNENSTEIEAKPRRRPAAIDA